MEDDHQDHKKQKISSSSMTSRHERKSKIRPSTTTMNHQVGLRIVAQISSSRNHQKQCYNSNNSNVVLKSAVRSRSVKKVSALESSCFLKKCNLCNKGLTLDKEIYMYRGDIGFCSKECRNRQIDLDEKRELEDSTKKMVAAYRSSCNSRTSETRSILEELIHSRKTYMNNRNNNNNNQHPRNNHSRAIFIF